MSDTNGDFTNNDGGNEGASSGTAAMPKFLTQLDGDLQKDERITSLGEITLSDFIRNNYFKQGEDLKSLREDSKGKVRPLGENATPEDVKAFRQAFDVPESIEGYEIRKPDNLPEGMVYDEVLANKILTTLHRLNAPKSLAQAIVKEYNDYYIDLHNKFNEYIKEGNQKRIQVLKDEWKGDYEKKNKETLLAISKFAEKAKVPEGFGGMEGFKKWLTDSSLDTDPMFNWMWNRVFELIGDDTFVKGGPSGGADASWRDVYADMIKK